MDAAPGLLNNELIGTPESRETSSPIGSHASDCVALALCGASENEASDLLRQKRGASMLSFFAPETSLTKNN